MTRFLPWSDLQRKMSDADFSRPTTACPAGSIDAILVNGNLNARGRHIEDAALIQHTWQVPVVLVWGNHDAQGSMWQDLLKLEQDELAE